MLALLEKWPASWAGVDDDKLPGRRLVAELSPFIAALIDRGLTSKTVRRHVDNLWAIGGEIVRSFNNESELRSEPARKLWLDIVAHGEAPLFFGAPESEQRSYDATALKLLKFLLSDETSL